MRLFDTPWSSNSGFDTQSRATGAHWNTRGLRDLAGIEDPEFETRGVYEQLR